LRQTAAGVTATVRNRKNRPSGGRQTRDGKGLGPVTARLGLEAKLGEVRVIAVIAAIFFILTIISGNYLFSAVFAAQTVAAILTAIWIAN